PVVVQPLKVPVSNQPLVTPFNAEPGAGAAAAALWLAAARTAISAVAITMILSRKVFGVASITRLYHG
ncbi:MAG: hypothetical protein ACRDZ8_05935, partial [Acidimicrobiales bacterium]